MVTCSITSEAAVSVRARVLAHAQTGTAGMNAQGETNTIVPAHTTVQGTVETRIDGALFDCSSATACRCSLGGADVPEAPQDD